MLHGTPLQSYIEEIMGKRGGRREWSGPKKSMSPYGEKTAVIRVPASLKSDVLVYLEPFRKRQARTAMAQRTRLRSMGTGNKDRENEGFPDLSWKSSCAEAASVRYTTDPSPFDYLNPISLIYSETW